MSLKVGAIFYSFNKYLLSIQLGTPRAWESNVSRAEMVPVLRGETLVDQARLPRVPPLDYPFCLIQSFLTKCLIQF